MTDNEIIKAFMCCTSITEDCLCCPALHKPSKCAHLNGLVLDLINRQKEEIERLQKYHDDMESAIYSLREDQAEVKFFKDRIRAEAIKDFAERLCEGRVSNDPVVIAAKCLLKEMTEGEQRKEDEGK